MTPDAYRQRRLDAGLSQPELARLLGVSVQAVRDRERGRIRITGEAVVALGAVTGRRRRSANCSPAALLERAVIRPLSSGTQKPKRDPGAS